MGHRHHGCCGIFDGCGFGGNGCGFGGNGIIWLIILLCFCGGGRRY